MRCNSLENLTDKKLYNIAINHDCQDIRLESIKLIKDRNILKEIASISGTGHDLPIKKEAIGRVTDRKFLKELCEKYRKSKSGISFLCFDRLQELTNSVIFILED